jgi:hypothetical protein
MKKNTLKSLYEAIIDDLTPDTSIPHPAEQIDNTEALKTPFEKKQPRYENIVKFITSNCNQNFMNVIESELMKRTKDLSNVDFNPSEFSLSAGKKNSSVLVFLNKNTEKALVIATIKPAKNSEMSVANVDHDSFKGVDPILYVPESGIFIGMLSFINHTQVVLDVNNIHAYITYNSIKYKQKRVK